ncbi:YdcF family protein [Devosia albogilva]|uniref:YdcF family protein n=1 Tax=Devosia albogilva TaxID=429726 RepID=A0ABW5QHK3_9HYPH
MFFVASKVFWLLAQPLGIVFLLMLAGLIALLAGRRRLAVAGLVLALLVHGLVSFTSLGFLLIQPLEARFGVPAEPPEQVGAIVMLGGATLARVSTARQVAELNAAGDRLVTTLWLARRYPDAPIVLSGGSGLLSGDTESEATTAERLLVAHGIAPERLRLEGESRNTDENAALTRDLLAGVDGPVVLVTSAFHMPRSVGLFEAQGIPVIPWPTDYRSSGREGFGIDIANPVHNLDVASIAIKEWIGLLAYHWTGRTGELLPSQASNSPAGTSSR